ncbi:DUF3299 domain-containing protein [Photobacterium rosenbergii]|uniref:DUF3299 domain-containing protein n=1 Tax=Photobacterium rosenbergii TaxID=294936 RepID=A0ABU3ZHU2_9GAMM|nr:DUF3299 domain-containing protein [Photobacterium rosenbergii]MDV5169645.1 DUF3299 domain-containing protein [Photobacterium rosenbergii]
MRFLRLGISLILMSLLPISFVSASEVEYDYSFNGEKFLSWRSLVLPTVTLDNPFEGMPYQQLDLLRTYTTLTERLANQSSEFSEEAIQSFKTALKEADTQLAEEGLNAKELYQTRNKIMAQREHQLNTPNPLVVDKKWKVAGFMAPIEFDGTKVIKFFMVPIAGACIHTPAPPPNQIILVEYEKGVEIKGLEYGFWVEGVLESDAVTDVASYYDGESVVDAIYTMKAEKIRFFE